MGDEDPRKDGPTYLQSKGWFWVEWVGQRTIYYGPYRTEADAIARHPVKGTLAHGIAKQLKGML